jgi:hypothetical protein
MIFSFSISISRRLTGNISNGFILSLSRRRKCDILIRIMLGLIEYPLKFTVIRKNPDKFEVWTLGTMTSVGGTGASVYTFSSGENPLKYTDPDGKAINFIAGAIAGAVVSGVIDTIFQLAENKGDISKINGARLAGAVVGGAVAGAITSGGSAIASITTSTVAKGVVVVTGTVAGAIGNGAGTITQNTFDGDVNTKPMDGVGESMVRGSIAGTVGGAWNVVRGNVPNVSYKASSYVTERPQASSSMEKAVVISAARALGEGFRDAGVDKFLDKTIFSNE